MASRLYLESPAPALTHDGCIFPLGRKVSWPGLINEADREGGVQNRVARLPRRWSNCSRSASTTDTVWPRNRSYPLRPDRTKHRSYMFITGDGCEVGKFPALNVELRGRNSCKSVKLTFLREFVWNDDFQRSSCLGVMLRSLPVWVFGRMRLTHVLFSPFVRDTHD